MFGIWTSNIRHRDSATDEDCRNDSADANVRAANPSDLTRFSIAARVKSSSSTIDISGVSVNGLFHSINKTTGCAVHDGATERLPPEIIPEW